MASRIKISKPERLPREGITDTDLNTWKNELLIYLGQDDDFDNFTESGIYPAWEAAENNPDRIEAHIAPDAATDLRKRRKQLNNFITIIAGCCYKDQYMTIIEQSTSLEWIWTELKNVYQITHVGKDFLNIVDIKYDPETMSASSIYNAYRAKIMENLKPKNTVIKWKSGVQLKSNESLTPTFEDHILLSVIQLIDPRLPSKVREIYGPRMDNEKFLMDFKQDILSNVPKMLEDLEQQDSQVNAINMQLKQATLAPVRFNNRRSHQKPNKGSYQRKFNSQNSDKFCRLCHLARQPRHIIASHEIGDLSCPSLSQRDKSALQQKSGMVAGISTKAEDDIANLAKLHGYDDTEEISEDDLDADHNQVKNHSQLNYISPVPSQILTLFQKDRIVHVDIDSGCWVSCVRADFAKSMSWRIQPNSQLAKLADDKTVLKSLGEIDEVLTRNNWKVQFKALVLPELHTEVIGGNNFLRDNHIEQSIHNRTITIHGKYVVPETNRNVELPTKLNPIIVKAEIPKAILPEQSVAVRVPFDDNNTVLVEPRIENSNKTWPEPQLCQVNNGVINIKSSTKDPAFIKTKIHHIQVRVTEETPTSSKMHKQYKYRKSHCTITSNEHESLNINYDNLNHQQRIKVDQAILDHKTLFDKDLSIGYNHHSGPHYCSLNWADEKRPLSKKVICPNYNHQLNNLLQEVCDELTDQGVLAIPQNDKVIVQYVSPCFLRKKQKAKDKPNSELTKQDVRLVVNTVGLSQYLKNIPTKITRPQEVYSSLSRWNFIIKTDLHQGFFQNHIHPSAYQWCAIQTPYGGMRYFRRSIQGLVGQTEEQDELLARILHKELKDGICVKIADDVFAGGKTIDEAIDNWIRIMKVLDDNNMKISPAKTILFPKQVDVLSWVWKEGGYLSPSPHRKLALQKVTHESIKTVKDMRSYLGLYKTFIDCTPNLTNFLDKFDQLVGSKQSNDEVTWTPELVLAFNKSKEHISQMKDLYLPRPEDQLIITCDGARTPPAVGMILQAKCSDKSTKIVKYFSVKLKPHMIKWNPCEIEACALGTAIESFYDYIKQSVKPVIICPDSKAVVDAAKKLAKGQFSLSPKIQTFLNNLSKIRYDIQHISGKSGHNAASDYQSRNSYYCNSDICQICTYVQNTADTIIDVKLNNISDTKDSGMPFLNRDVWRNLQSRDHACKQAKICLSSGQQPTKKAGNTNNNIRRYVAKADIAKDGLLIVKTTIPMSTTKQEQIIIPSNFVEAIVTQLHIKFQHPSKSQLLHLFNRYFFAPGSNKMIENMYEKCQICQANKRLPSALTTYTNTTSAEHPGTHFGVDVMRRAKQKILIARDQFSSFVTATFIPDETKSTLRDAVIKVIDPVRTRGPVVVRTDNAAAFKSLALKDEALNRLGIAIELSDPNNKNGNACVDRAIAEIIDEIKKVIPTEQPISQSILSQAVLQLNSKIRRGGKLSASEILFSRDQMNNQNLTLQDQSLQYDQKRIRDQANDKHNSKIVHAAQNLKQGDIIQLKDNPKKHQARDTYLVVDVNDNDDRINAKKILNVHNDKKAMIRNQKYSLRKQTIEKIHKSTLSRNYVQDNSHKTKISYSSSWTPFKNREPSDDDSIEDNSDTADNVEIDITDGLIGNIENQSIDDDSIDENNEDGNDTIINENEIIETDNENEILIEQVDVNAIEQLGDHSNDVMNEVSTAETNNTEPGEMTDDDWHDANDGDDETYDANRVDKGEKSKQRAKKKTKEFWLTKETHNLRYTAARKARMKDLDQKEILREAKEYSLEAPPSKDSTRTRIVSSDDNTIVEPNIEWDDYQISPTYFERPCLNELEDYPENVEEGRVYDFSHLPPIKLYPETVEYGKVYDFSEHLPLPIRLNDESSDNATEKEKKSKRPKLLKKIRRFF